MFNWFSGFGGFSNKDSIQEIKNEICLVKKNKEIRKTSQEIQEVDHFIDNLRLLYKNVLGDRNNLIIGSQKIRVDEIRKFHYKVYHRGISIPLDSFWNFKEYIYNIIINENLEEK